VEEEPTVTSNSGSSSNGSTGIMLMHMLMHMLKHMLMHMLMRLWKECIHIHVQEKRQNKNDGYSDEKGLRSFHIDTVMKRVDHNDMSKSV
jgi:hypothetical protein